MRKLLLILLFGTLAGCSTWQPSTPDQPEGETVTAAPSLPFEIPEMRRVEFDGELLFDYLVGEIGAREGEFETAQHRYLNAARAAGDAYAAERATLIALHRKDLAGASEAASLWTQFAPNDMDARKYLGVLNLRQNRFEEAVAEFDAMRRIADALGKNGRLEVASVLVREPGRDAARKVLEQVLADDPDVPESLYASALLAAAHGRTAQAEEELREAIRARRDWSLARILLSRVLVARRKQDEALQVLEEGVRLQPDDKLLRHSYARMLVTQGSYPAALEQFRELHRISPEDAAVTYAYAMLATEQEDWELARKLWQTLRNEAKYYSEASYFLAQIEEQEGNLQLALGLYRAINEGPLVADAAIRGARLAQRTGDLQLARSMLRDARLREPKRAIDLYLTEVQVVELAEAPIDEILALYEEALRFHPDDTDLLYNRGLYLSEVGRYREMEADFRRVLDLDPENANALNALGYMLAEQNIRLQEARGYIEKALRLKPDLAAILDSMGWVLYRLGDLQGAREYLKQAYAKDQDAEIAAHLIEVLWHSGEKQAAQEVFRAASRKTADSPHLSSLRERLFPDLP